MRIDESKALNPGLLRHRITWQTKAVSSRNDFGEDVYSWVDVVSVACQVRPLAGREMQAAQQRWAESKYRITQHYVPGMERAERGAWFVDGEYRYLDILDINDRAGIGRVMEITAKEWTE